MTLVADRVTDAHYRARLGIMTQIREDFQRMAALLADSTTNDKSPDAAGDQLPRIDRIVIYVDDLDRCPPPRVVAMLEAIHLLLATDLFVVVVAVDPRWLLSAIGAHYHDLLASDELELRQSTPEQYLEKIFQVVLTLPPMNIDGYQRLLNTLVGTREDQPVPPPVADLATTLPNHHGNTVGAPTAMPDDLFGVTLPAPRIVERVDPLTLEPDELALLNLLGPPVLVTNPRAVKRLANSYGLLTAIRRHHRAVDLTAAHHPYRASLVLLAALVAHTALGPALLTRLHEKAATDPDATWADFMADLDADAPSRRFTTSAVADQSVAQLSAIVDRFVSAHNSN
jgi:hypothetical protein